MIIEDRIGIYLQPGRSWIGRQVNTIKKFSVHHDAIPQGQSADQVLKAIFAVHNSKNGWPGISYHYYIHPDGKVYMLNKHEWVTWIDGINFDALGIVLGGYFHAPYNNDPQPSQLASLDALLDDLSTNHPEFPASQKDTYAHRERAQTACPGDKAISYVVEYRTKLGNVPWGTSSNAGIDVDKLKSLLWFDNDWWENLYRVKEMRKYLPQSGAYSLEKVRTLLWYDNAWWNSLYRVQEMRKVLKK